MNWPWSRTNKYKAAEDNFITKDEALDKKVADGIKAGLAKQRLKDVRAAKEKEVQVFKTNYTPVGPRYKIAEDPEGGYKILERRVKFSSVDGLYYFNGYNKTPPTIEVLEEFSPRAVEEYIPLCEQERVHGKTVRIFSTFYDAEYFLLRMASPSAYETHYNGDPLKRV